VTTQTTTERMDDVIAAARGGESDRYWSALLTPKARRADLLAIAAFSAEMRRIPMLIKEPMMGEIRLQWWRDSIDSGTTGLGTTGLGAVADALTAAVRRHDLPRPLVHAMTEARAFDLYDDPMADEASFHGYLTKTEGVPFALALQIVGAQAPPALSDHAGRAYGIARVLVDLPVWLAKGRLPLPATYLTEAGADADDMKRGAITPGVSRLFDRLITGLKADATAAATMARHLPRGQRVALHPIATIPTYLRAFHTARQGPFRSQIEASPLKRITRIARAHWLGL
jgi:15-cis-phytoene synthase